MAQVRDGDVGKLGILFERHHRSLFGFFLRSTGRAPASEDLVQEVFVRMLKYRRTFRAQGEFVPWMFKLARNVAADHFGRGRHERPAPEEVPEPVSAEPSAPEELERAESARLLRAALQRLPQEKREVLVLSRFGNLRYDQIAALLGTSEGAVKVRVHRALKQLRQAYDGLAQEARA
jgi:RNA polymerase sigma-70 factor (ECF subfamily)